MPLTPRQKAEFEFRDVLTLVGLLNELAEAEPHLNRAGVEIMSPSVAGGIIQLYGLLADFETVFRRALDEAWPSPAARSAAPHPEERP